VIRRLLPLCLLVALLPLGGTAQASTKGVLVRIDQVGFTPGAAKRAVVMSPAAAPGMRWHVVDAQGTTVLKGTLGAALPSWNTNFPYEYGIDLTPLHAAGTYRVLVGGGVFASSPLFRIASGHALYAPLVTNALRFYLAQRDGAGVDPSVLDRQPSHLTDASATAYLPPDYKFGRLQGGFTPVGGPPVDVEGGWFDAGDYLKFVQTASYTDAVLLMAARDNGVAQDEARYGTDWLQKMWDDQTRTLYYQVGIGNGTSQIVSDHDVWRLPQADDALNVSPGDPRYYLKYRPVFRAGPPGSPVSPNLAGRLAADFGLCYQVWHQTDPAYAGRCLLAGEHVLALARTTGVGKLLTASPHGFYPESEWRSDMALGATELARALELGDAPAGLPVTNPATYLRQAGHWAATYLTSSFNGTDSLNLYDVSALADFELVQAMAAAPHTVTLQVSRTQLIDGMAAQLAAGQTRADGDAFRFGMGYGGGDSTPHALGYAVTASLYQQLTGSTAYRTFGQEQLDWVLGDNAWGSSFIVGAGSTFPECMQSQVANLSGSLNGTAPLMLGATVDGPEPAGDFSGLGIPAGALHCPVVPGNPYKPYDGQGDRYIDNVISWPSVEPTDDYTVLGLLLFARMS